MKESHQLDVAYYQQFRKKYGQDVVRDVAFNICIASIEGKSIHCDGRHGRDTFDVFKMGYELAKKLPSRYPGYRKPGAVRLYMIFDDCLVYIFAAYNVHDLIKQFKTELRKMQEDFPV
jgi:hypothetical protein